MIRRTSIARLFAAVLVAAAVATPAKAGLLPVSVSVTPEAGNFRWTYSVVLPTDMQLQAGSYFTVYDFGGYIPGTGGVLSPYPDDSAVGNWSVSVQNSGNTPALTNPTDDPSISNITWTYTGPTIPAGQLTLGNFIASSLFSDAQTSSFTAQNPRAADGIIDSNITSTLSPTGQITPPPPGVPEPTTLALAGLGLPIVGVARWYRRRGAKQ
jgi:hypothetical protein